MELYLIQHGMTDWNAKRRSQGHVDVPLNETGHKQAKALAEYLSDTKFDAIYSSDLSRTVESIRPLAEKQGLEVTSDWRLREGRWPHQGQGRGVFEVLPFFIESETHKDVLHRLVKFLEEISLKYPNGRVLLMTHGSVLTRLVFHLEGYSKWPFPPFQMQKMSVNVLRKTDENVWEDVVLNDADFLAKENLLVGRKRRKRRSRRIVYTLGNICRNILPEFLHPVVQKILRAAVDKDRNLAVNPYHELKDHPTNTGTNTSTEIAISDIDGKVH